MLSSSLFSHKKKERNFLENGRILLAEFVTQWNGRSKIPIRNFSAEELAIAVNNFNGDHFLYEERHYKIYRGYFEKRPILVKKYHTASWMHLRQIAKRDIVISSQMSVHKNVLKMLGCCLDSEDPALVYQCPEATDLTRPLFYTEELKLTWKNRLSIASDIANALAFLHSAFPTPIIHRNLKLNHVVIDRYGSAKISDFSYCIPVPLGESQVKDDVSGFFWHKYSTEKTDVCSMGEILVELLMGKKAWDIEHGEGNINSLFEFLRRYTEEDKVKDIVNGDIVIEGETGQDEQFRANAALALRCLDEEWDDGPKMVDVVTELRKILGSGCLSLRNKESQVKDVVLRAYGRIDPKYVMTGILTEKADVYSMGLILLQLLTGKNPLHIMDRGENFSTLFEFMRSYTEDDNVKDIVNGDIVMEGETGQDEQFRAFAALALRCLEKEWDDRPEMVDVVKELRKIQGLGCTSSSM